MNTLSTFTRKPLAILLSAVLLASSSYALADTKTIDSKDTAVEEVVANEGWNSENLEKMAAHTGREVIHHLVVAQENIDKDQSGKARGNLVAAQRLNYSLMQIMPFVVVGEEVFNAKGKLALGEMEVFYDQLLPIYSELNEMEIYAPVPAKKAKAHLKNAEKAARKGDNEAAATSLQNVFDTVSKTSLYLPVMYVEGQLKAALYSLNQPTRDTKTAQKAIKNAVESLQVNSENLIATPSS